MRRHLDEDGRALAVAVASALVGAAAAAEVALRERRQRAARRDGERGPPQPGGRRGEVDAAVDAEAEGLLGVRGRLTTVAWDIWALGLGIVLGFGVLSWRGEGRSGGRV